MTQPRIELGAGPISLGYWMVVFDARKERDMMAGAYFTTKLLSLRRGGKGEKRGGREDHVVISVLMTIEWNYAI